MHRQLVCLFLAALAALSCLISPVAHADIYKWTDDGGVMHFTDEPGNIPPKYQKQKKQIEVREGDFGVNNELDRKRKIVEDVKTRAVGTKGLLEAEISQLDHPIAAKQAECDRLNRLVPDFPSAFPRYHQCKDALFKLELSRARKSGGIQGADRAYRRAEEVGEQVESPDRGRR